MNAKNALSVAVLGLTLALLAGSAAAHSLTGYSPLKPAAGIGQYIYIYGSGIGSAADVVQYPDGTEVGATTAGPGWIRARVPNTWSGQFRVLSATSLTWSDYMALDVSYNWTQTQWNPADLPLQWYMNSAGAPGCTFTDTQNALIRGYDAWECASDVSTAYLGSTAVLANNNADGINVQGWSNSGWSSGTIAVTSWRYWVATGDIIEFDIGYNAQHFNWACNGSTTAMDVGNVGTHEMGHSIGLADLYGSADFNDTMYGVGTNGETLRRTVNLDDVQGAEYMYPRAGRPNVTWSTPSGWSFPVVPRNTNDATGTSTILPASLNDNTTSYINVASRNNGLDCAAPYGPHRLYLDGVWNWTLTWLGVWNPGVDLKWNNLAMNVRGGRHTYRVDYDIDNEIVEGSEVDNTIQFQYAYSPLGLSDQVPLARSAPPEPGGFVAPNSDGFSFTGDWWSAFAVLPTASDDDYDAYLYAADSGATTGFSTPLKTSFTGSGGSDFVLVNGNLVGHGATRYGGLVRYNANSNASAQVEHCNPVGSTLVPSDVYGEQSSTGTVTMGSTGIVRVHEVYLSDPAVTYGFKLDNLTGGANLNMTIYNAVTDYFGKWNYSAGSFGAGADEYFEYQPPQAGYYCVVVWKNTAADHGLSNTYQLSVGKALSNLSAQVTRPGFFGPVVPRTTNDATTLSCLLPTTLDGNTANTYLNWNTNITGVYTLPAWENDLLVDGVIRTGTAWSGGTPGYNYSTLNIGPITVPGGRHTITQDVDPTDAIVELSETDNGYSQQFIWSPLVVAKDSPVVRSTPPFPGILPLPNSDGMAFVPTASHSWVTALAPYEPTDDYDLHLYDDYTDSQNGFSNLIGYSGHGSNATEFVVGHFSGGYSNLYPASVLWGAGDFDDVAVDQSDTQGHRAGATGSFTETFEPNKIVDVYGALLQNGMLYSFRLERLSGTDDITMSVFASGGVHGRSDALAYATPSAPHLDYMEFTANNSSWFPVVVYRTDGTEAQLGVDYMLTWQQGSLTSAPDEPTTQFSFRGGFPNPSPGSTNLEFALPVGGPVNMTIHNVRGQRVRTLLTQSMPAGRHSVHWDGRDNRGSTVASGAYWVRLDAAGQSKTKKITVIR